MMLLTSDDLSDISMIPKKPWNNCGTGYRAHPPWWLTIQILEMVGLGFVRRRAMVEDGRDAEQSHDSEGKLR